MAIVVALYALLMLQYLPETKATTVEVTVPVHPVTVGGILALQCHIQSMDDAHKVKIQRVGNGQPEEITSDLLYYPSALEQRVFVTKRTMPDGSNVYFMTVVDLTILDTGKYSCKVYDFSSGEYVKVAEDSIDVDIYYLPDPIYPQCQSTPSETKNINENVNLRLTCISSRGIPTVALQWKTFVDIDIVPRNKYQDDTVSTEINLRTTTSHDGVSFICEMTSPGFPDLIRTCQIGPITIRRQIEREHTEILPPVVTTRPINQDMLTSATCNTECPSEDQYIILYLSIATIVAAMLCLVFLTTTIIWCYKYNKISTEARDAQRNITSSDGVNQFMCHYRGVLIMPETPGLCQLMILIIQEAKC
ncbi:uncharacterized protein [Amphiura filiformis]|uniref:uncharacterized protein n=1 Tax=Amphiura filiformis TaxID=82378 RepID=UPI003B212316